MSSPKGSRSTNTTTKPDKPGTKSPPPHPSRSQPSPLDLYTLHLGNANSVELYKRDERLGSQSRPKKEVSPAPAHNPSFLRYGGDWSTGRAGKEGEGKRKETESGKGHEEKKGKL